MVNGVACSSFLGTARDKNRCHICHELKGAHVSDASPLIPAQRALSMEEADDLGLTELGRIHAAEAAENFTGELPKPSRTLILTQVRLEKDNARLRAKVKDLEKRLAERDAVEKRTSADLTRIIKNLRHAKSGGY